MTTTPGAPSEREAIAKIDVKAIWREHGGSQHGLHVEHYYIEEQAFYRFAVAFAGRVLALRPPAPESDPVIIITVAGPDDSDTFTFTSRAEADRFLKACRGNSGLSVTDIMERAVSTYAVAMESINETDSEEDGRNG